MSSPKKAAGLRMFAGRGRAAGPNPRIRTLAMVVALVVVSLSQNLAQSTSGSGEFPSIGGHTSESDSLIPRAFFGMHIGSIQTPWPLADVGMLRLHATHSNWDQIERSPGVYNFKVLDKWIAHARHHNAGLVYTFVAVPQFYSSKPNDRSCNYAPGACHPPQDLNADGTGTDAAFKNFVTALVNHVGNKIQYWEIWNEPNEKTQWIPTDSNLPYSQMVRMAQDAGNIIKAANPSALMLTPAPVGYPTGAEQWLDGYLGAGGGAYADVIAYHGYLNQSWKQGAYPIAENEVRLVGAVRRRMQQHGQENKPMWITEGGWGNIRLTGFKDPILQSAFAARYLLLQQSLGIAHAFWYQWDNSTGAGTLWKGPKQNDLRMPGVAYQQVAKWTSGATLTAACKPYENGTIWTCQYARRQGYQAMAIWNTAGLSEVNVPPQFKRGRGLLGTRWKLGKTVTVGIWPILLEN